jgi:ankyrin repeat protein
LLQHFPDSEPKHRHYLIDAAEADNIEAVCLLLDTRPSKYVNRKDYFGRTALFVCKDADVTRLLLKRGADPRIVDGYRQTPLMMNGGAARARVLLEAAPDLLNAKDMNGRAAISHLSYRDTQFETLKGLFLSAEEFDLDAEVSNREKNGDTALHFAMVSRNLPTVKLLLENGAEVLGSGYEGTTALMKALLDPEIILSKYGGTRHNVYYTRETEKDADTHACLKVVLDAMVLRGGEAGVEAKTVETGTKRRRV